MHHPFLAARRAEVQRLHEKARRYSWPEKLRRSEKIAGKVSIRQFARAANRGKNPPVPPYTDSP
jgi:hypothetical protein